MIEFTKESGEVVLTENFASELLAQRAFDELQEVRWPKTYKGLTLNLSEYFTGGNIGSVRLIVETSTKRFERRELFRNA